MPSSRRILAAAFAALVVGAGAVPVAASAADYTWAGGNFDNWSDGTKWAGGTAPSGTVGTLSFPASACCGIAPNDDVAGLSASTISAATTPGGGAWDFTGSPSIPLTLRAGLTTDGRTGFGMPLVLSASNTWTVTHGIIRMNSGVSGGASLDVRLLDGSLSPSASGVSFAAATSNEVGPVSITGSAPPGTATGADVTVGGTLGKPGDLNGTNGNPVTLKNVQLDGNGKLGALTTSNVRVFIGQVASVGHVQVASATFDPNATLAFALRGSGTPGVDYSQMTSTGPIELGGARLNFDTGNACPAMGGAYTLITTTGPLTGTVSGGTGDDAHLDTLCGTGQQFSYHIHITRTGATKTVTATVEPKDEPPRPPITVYTPVSRPTIAGIPEVGQTLTATHGTYSPAMTAGYYSGFWWSCPPSASTPTTSGDEVRPGCVVRQKRSGSSPGAVSYRLGAKDVGTRMFFTELPNVTRAQTSAPTAVVRAASQPGPTRAKVTAALRKIGGPGGKASVRSVLAKGVTLTFAAPSAGTVSVAWYQVPRGARVTAVAKKKARPVLVARGTRKLSKAGRVKLVVKPTTAGRRLLKAARKANRSLKLTGKASFTPKGGKRTSRIAAFRLKR